MRPAAIGSAVVLATVAFFLLRPPVVDVVDNKTFDVLTRWAGPGESSGNVVIVEIDESSLARVGRWPWSRDLMGRLSRSILDRGAAVVVLDAMFPQEQGAGDRILAEAISGRPAVVGYELTFDPRRAGAHPCSVSALPVALVGPAESANRAFFRAAGAVCSAPAISGAAAANGFLNAAPDHDGALRTIPLVIQFGDLLYPSLALAAVNLYRPPSNMRMQVDISGDVRLHLDGRALGLEPRGGMRLRFRGARRTFPYVSAADVLAGNAAAGLLRGRIAVVGGSAAGVESTVVTPVDALFPDVEIQATAVDNLLSADVFRRPAQAWLWDVALALLAGFLSTIFLARLHSPWSALATVALALSVWTFCALAVAFGRTLFSPAAATAVLGLNLPILTFLNYLHEKKRADGTEQQLAAARQRSQEIQRENESRYRRLVENVNDAIIVEDAGGRLQFANRRFREWFGLREEDIPDAPLEQYVAPEWRAEMRARRERLMRGEDLSGQFEFEGVRSDGSRVWLESLVTAIEENGRIVGSQSALRDTTERRRMEAQYLHAQKMESIGRIAGGVAHDFNNLLTVINGYSEILMSQPAPTDEARIGLEQIRKAGESAAELTRKLLAFSRKQVVRPRPLNLNLVVADAEQMLARVIGEDVELITSLSPGLRLVMADPGQMHQVLMNLVVNARDAMPGGGKLTVTTANLDDHTAGPLVYLAVSDTGTGIPDEIKKRLFEPFFTTKEQGKGTGLGLATVYGIVNQSGGRIDVSSVPGRGSTFHIYLPGIASAEAEQPGISVRPASLQGVETILVVEDQDAVRELATTILKNYGYTVFQASNGLDALALAGRCAGVIHLLLTDIILPHMDGRVLAARLQALRPETKVLYISGYSEERLGENAALDSQVACLRKPFTSEALAAKVREVLGAGSFQRPTSAAT